MITPFQIGYETARLVYWGMLSIFSYPRIDSFDLDQWREFVRGERAFRENI
jgi:hypothetical protein